MIDVTVTKGLHLMPTYIARFNNSGYFAYDENLIKEIKIQADDLDQAYQFLDQQMRCRDYGTFLDLKLMRGGYRFNSGNRNQASKWGSGIKTKVVRIPEVIVDKIVPLIQSLEGLEMMLSQYQDDVDKSCSLTQTGQPSERYKHLARLLEDLEEEMMVIKEVNQLLDQSPNSPIII